MCRPEPGYETCKYVFLPGCQAGAIAPESVRRAYADLRSRLSGGVGILLGCCGIISHWAGREELFDVEWLPADVSLMRSLAYYWDEAFSDQLL